MQHDGAIVYNTTNISAEPGGARIQNRKAMYTFKSGATAGMLVTQILLNLKLQTLKPKLAQLGQLQNLHNLVYTRP